MGGLLLLVDFSPLQTLEKTIFPVVWFIGGYIFGLTRLILYPLNVITMTRAYSQIRNKPKQVFDTLQKSALHQDECVYLPLPYLERMLLIAYEQNSINAIEEIDFIVQKRPQQRRSAWAVCLELVLCELEIRDTLVAIIEGIEHVETFTAQEVGRIDPLWNASFGRLNDACQDALSYTKSRRKASRQDALKNMINNLKRASNTLPDAPPYNNRMDTIIHTWINVAKAELAIVEKASLEEGQIDNPYVAGHPIEQGSSLFVGRNRIFEQLRTALSKEKHRPTFFLTGERRMGKTSILNQLPKVLGSNYYVVNYDLQSPSMRVNGAEFLTNLARNIQKTLTKRNVHVRLLEYDTLQKAKDASNEKGAYARFDEWLDQVEELLEHDQRTLVLTFDEFERLNEIGEGYSETYLFLDWLRSAMQNRARIAVIFCGLRNINEMGSQWSSYFVNVQTLNIGYLQQKEATLLITQPERDFPGKAIFSDEIVSEIIRVTGRHPFFIQCVCSALVAILNSENRLQATLQDVEVAMDQVVESWAGTVFKEQWERADEMQQYFLKLINELGKADKKMLEKHRRLNTREIQVSTQEIQKILNELVERNLIKIEPNLIENEYNTYSIYSPLISRFIKHVSRD